MILRKILKFAFITILVLLILGSVFVFGGFYFPTNIVGEQVENKLYTINNDSLIDNQGLKLHVFNTGMNKVSSLLVGSVNPWRPAPAFVIEHPRLGFIVFDSGLSTEIAEKGKKALHPITGFLFDARTKIGRDLPAQMKSEGIAVVDVKKMIFSHLHFDHLGNADAFINAIFYIGEGTNIDKLTKMNGFEPDFVSKLAKNHPFKVIKFAEGKPYATFKKTIDLFGDGTIIAIQGNGHQNGSIALMVNLPNNPVLLAGDEVVHFDWLESNDVQHLATNKNEAANFRNQVRMLIKLIPELIVFPGHDLSKVPTNKDNIILHKPDWFEKKAWNLK